MCGSTWNIKEFALFDNQFLYWFIFMLNDEWHFKQNIQKDILILVYWMKLDFI